MARQQLHGSNHHRLVEKLATQWWEDSSPVCLIEGFPGMGKTRIAEELENKLKDSEIVCVRVEMPDASNELLDQLLADIAFALELKDDARLSEKPTLATLLKILAEPVLLVIDELQSALQDEKGTPCPALRKLLNSLTTFNGKGRVLLLSSRSVERDRCTERWDIHSLIGLPTQEAIALLDKLAADLPAQTIPAQVKAELVEWLGGSPRALGLFVNRLRYDPFDDVFGLAEHAWETSERKVSAELLEEFEEKIFDRACRSLPPAAYGFLERLAVFRKPIEPALIEHLAGSHSEAKPLLTPLIDHMIVELRGRYQMSAVSRATVLRKAKPKTLEDAHRQAGDWFARHLRAARIVVADIKLGDAYFEARYHFAQASDTQALREIGNHFLGHVQSSIHWTTPLPVPAERDDRIHFLSAVLEAERSALPALQFYLARMLEQRKQPGDLARALQHARIAVSLKSDLSDPWVFILRLEAAQAPDAIERTFTEYEKLGKARADVYVAAAKALQQTKRPGQSQRLEKAIDILLAGIERIPSESNLYDLYITAAEILNQGGDAKRAITLLKQGLERVKPPHSKNSLYVLTAELFAQEGDTDNAMALLRKGFVEIPPEYNLFSLYQSAARILSHNGQLPECLAVLQEGCRNVRDQFKYLLCQLYIALSAADVTLMHSPLSKPHSSMDGKKIHALAAVLTAELMEDWPLVIELCDRCRADFPPLIDVTIREAFAWLCLGQAQKAKACIFSHRNLDIEFTSWFLALISLHCGDLPSARDYLSLHTGEPIEGDAADLLNTLLLIWDGTAGDIYSRQQAYYFPHLPPSITGYSHTLTRRAFGPSILPQAAGPKERTLPMPAQTPAQRPLHILTIATEWFSRKGGLSTFNRQMCIALSQAGHRVACLVPGATGEEIDSARAQGVELVFAQHPHDDWKITLVCGPQLPEGFDPDLIIGHDHITGGAARAQQVERYRHAKRIHFIHTAPSRIEWYKAQQGTTATKKAEDKAHRQAELAKSADLVVAVGKLLWEEISTQLHGVPGCPPIHQLDPGFEFQPQDRTPAPISECLLLGRTEDDELKGLDIAARAFGLLQVSPGKPRLIVRGAETGKGDELRGRMLQWAGRAIDIFPREYSTNAERLDAEIKRAAMLLMPSRTEGFGLVGLEAIAAGTPVLVSEESGLAMLLKDHCPEEVVKRIVLPVTGDREEVAKTWEQHIRMILLDRESALRNAQNLAQLLAEQFTWSNAANRLLEAIASIPSNSHQTQPA